MPNWCWNNLTVMCTKEHVAELHDFVDKSTSIKDAEFSFEGTHPMPKELEGTTAPSDKPNWYDWRCDNWGTKWDACEPYINESEPQCFSVGFDSAWVPPTEWLRNIMDDYPNLEFELEYDEPGMCFAGVLNVHAAKGTFHDYYFETDSASECCEAKVYYEGEDDYTLTEDDTKGSYSTEYQCSECKEECETFMMNASKIKNNV